MRRLGARARSRFLVVWSPQRFSANAQPGDSADSVLVIDHRGAALEHNVDHCQLTEGAQRIDVKRPGSGGVLSGAVSSLSSSDRRWSPRLFSVDPGSAVPLEAGSGSVGLTTPSRAGRRGSGSHGPPGTRPLVTVWSQKVCATLPSRVTKRSALTSSKLLTCMY